jgi:hypothetical protein
MRPAAPSAAVLASRLRYAEQRIMAALERRGVRHVHLDPRTCWAGSRLVITRDARCSACALEAAGVTVVNRAEATRISGGKWHTSGAPLNQGLPTLGTALATTPEAAVPALEWVGFPAVLGPLVGRWGRPVSRLPEAAVPALEWVGFPAVLRPLVGRWGQPVSRLPDDVAATTGLPSPRSLLTLGRLGFSGDGRDVKGLQPAAARMLGREYAP